MSNDLIARIDAFCTTHSLFPQGAQVVLGLSGGPDSIFLLHLLAERHRAGRLHLIAAHLDHEWRIDSAKDAAFCKEITRQLGIECIVKKASECASFKANGSKEELGRKMRRAFFETVRQEYAADVIALAHH